MTIADIIAIIVAIPSVGGPAVLGISRLARIAAAVERIEPALGTIVKTVQDHENRLNKGGL